MTSWLTSIVLGRIPIITQTKYLCRLVFFGSTADITPMIMEDVDAGIPDAIPIVVLMFAVRGVIAVHLVAVLLMVDHGNVMSAMIADGYTAGTIELSPIMGSTAGLNLQTKSPSSKVLA